MLKKITLNKRRVPVPVPIRTLEEAISWVETSLMQKDHMITRIELDGQDVDPADLASTTWKRKELGIETNLTIQVDSPMEICIQTIDVIKNLSMAIERSLKPLAVDTWQTATKSKPQDLDMLISDLDLCQDLVRQVFILMENRPVCLANLSNLAAHLNQHYTKLTQATARSDWKAVAKVMLNEFEPFLAEFSQELSFLQKSIFETVAEESFARAKNG